MNSVINPERYNRLSYRPCGRSGLKLPEISLGLWHNFGHVDSFATSRDMIFRAFDLGITHFDLANNYGPPPGSAEENFGRIMQELAPYRDEMIISSKAGYYMWPGPYGDGGSRKYLISSLDQSLKRMGLEYVDIFYHHRPDPATPLEETMAALDQIQKQGKALYVGISNYPADATRTAASLLHSLGSTCLIHQPSYSMFNRWIEPDLLRTVEELGIGCIAFSPLAQGLLSDKYLKGIPSDSRAGKEHGFLRPSHITDDKIRKATQLNDVAGRRGQTLSQMAIAWILRHPAITSVLIGASKISQIEENVAALQNISFSQQELSEIDGILQ
jgi:L-glyceraldehyde 3-phosphate reductase